LKLAFDYRGESHYTELHSARKKHDVEKQKKSHDRGVTYIEVPFWWTPSEGSLVATIRNYRPDITGMPHSESLPISSQPPEKVRDKVVIRPKEIVPTTKREVTKKITEKDPTGW
jgi:hypothetical protein